MFRTRFDQRVLELLEELNQRTLIMAIDLTALTAAEARLVADVKTLLDIVVTLQKTGVTDAAAQAAIDAITANLAGEATAVEAVTSPAVGGPSTGTTGTSP